MTQILHYTIGPVQSFVGQSRRTRDLWAGSFLLSWMAGQAMSAIITKLRGRITFPVVQDKTDPSKIIDQLLKAIMNQPDHGNPNIGTLPNRFKVLFDTDVDSEKINRNVTEYILQKWKELSDAVWDEFVKSAANKGKDTEKIWDRQINNFWEINWVLGTSGDSKKDDHWLDIRKNWRSHWPVPQGGDHCTLMGDWQEISGYTQTPWHGRQEQQEFWKELQSHEQLGLFELRESERLCAIALVKRLFPRLNPATLRTKIGWVPGENPTAVGNWPSTAYMAAIPWLSHVVSSKKQSLLSLYAQHIKSSIAENQLYGRLSSERATKIKGLHTLGEAAALDGNLFHLDALSNHRSTPLTMKPLDKPSEERAATKIIRESILAKLRKTNKALGHTDAQPFYALLVMDGDRLGKMLQNDKIDKDNENISCCLMKFTRKAEEIVDKNQGILLYAGGDDVLAMVSVQTAIECARELHDCYSKVFTDDPVLKPHGSEFTASASIIYAHFQTPLKTVLQQGHHLLNTVAKEENKRDSLALAVLKPGGVTGQWVGRFSMTDRMLTLIKEIRDGGFSTSFFYNLKTRYPALHKEEYDHIPMQDKKDILLAEFCKGKNITDPADKTEAQRKIRALLSASGRQMGDKEEIDIEGMLQLDAAYIAGFIVDISHNFKRKKGA